MPRPDSTSAFSAPAGAHLPVELLRRYVAGELPPAEEHAVEAHTLDCAVCADLLEGLEIQPTAAHEASMDTLRQRLHTRVAELATETAPEPTVVPLWAWRPFAAAAVLLLSLGVVGWLTISRLNSSPEIARQSLPAATRQSEVAATVRPAEPAATASPAVAAVTPKAPTSPVRRPVLAPRYRRPIVVADAETAPEQPADLAGLAAFADSRPAAAAAEVAATVPEPAAVMMSKAEPVAGNADVAAAPQPAAAKAKMARVAGVAAAAPAAAPEATRTIQGRVTDNAGQPLPGATVLVPGTQNGTSTDADGKFQMSVPAATGQLLVTSIGYTSKTQPLRPSDSTLALALSPDTKQLSEVVVVRREAPPMLPSISATPAGGYGKLRQYLADSLDYPEKALTDRREGTVRVQFIVGADGKLSDFKVVKSVSPECDEEALRLLKEGPTWFPAVQNNRRTARKVVVNVPFKIEQR
ncbi:TonB family protein [Hymenobacter rigui]|uniref:TonB family protein n=1 Tax=Hymenobacter rigui TaxID=334424 RepID=A0A428KNU7_9BACT|nr:TonB family protein [Hymenobacter rigui]RSK48082.1 TonB family protein [Hymenobacter rigui]